MMLESKSTKPEIIQNEYFAISLSCRFKSSIEYPRVPWLPIYVLLVRIKVLLPPVNRSQGALMVRILYQPPLSGSMPPAGATGAGADGAEGPVVLASSPGFQANWTMKSNFCAGKSGGTTFPCASLISGMA